MILLALLLALHAAPLVRAAPPEGLARNMALRVLCLPDGEGVSGMQFRLYYVASVTEDGTYTVVEPYASAGITSEMLSDSSRRNEAMTLLAALINGGGAEADAEGTTDDAGQSIMRNLADGVYLCSSNTRFVKADGTTYTPVAFLFRLNAALASDRIQLSVDEVTAVTKFSVETRLPPDTNPPDSRPPTPPDTPDGTPPDNNPPNTPDGTPPDNNPPDTPVDIPDEGPPTDERETPDDTPEMEIPDEEPPLDYVEILDDPVPLANLELPDPDEDSDDFLNIEDEDVPLAERLPQTGLLWWPVPVMALTGLFLFMLGWRKTGRA